MTDPNAVYKDSFHNLAAKLGRVPDTRDKEYWEIGDQLRKGFEQWKTSPANTAGNSSYSEGGTTSGTTAENNPPLTDCVVGRDATTGPPPIPTTSPAISEMTAPQASELPESSAPAATGMGAREGSEATGEARVIGMGVRERTTGEAGNGAVRDCQTATGAWQTPVELRGRGRGPNGGVMAVCIACGSAWERPRQPGRPSLLCGECR